MKIIRPISLTKGKCAIIDEEDYELINHFKWRFTGRYATTTQNGTTIFMHRIIMNAPDGMDVHHVNHNKLDNRRSNLRICSHIQNCAGNGLNKLNTSGKKGVSWDKKANKWRVMIRDHGKHLFLGYFDDIEEASNTYKQNAIEIHGEFAYIGD